MGRVQERRKRGQGGSRAAAFCPPSLQIKTRFSPRFLWYRAGREVSLCWEGEVVVVEQNGAAERGWGGLQL
jgi:hypothetical protein